MEKLEVTRETFRRLSLILFSVMSLMVSGVSALEDKQAPPVDEDCMGEDADYDCQPTNLEEEDFDRIVTTVPMERDLPALRELEPLDSEDALIKRYMLNARGIMGFGVAIPDSGNLFCTLSSATNVSLQYAPASGLWEFVVAFSPEAELMAGGLATCLDAEQAAKQFGRPK